jgi:hypothetical protein
LWQPQLLFLGTAGRKKKSYIINNTTATNQLGDVFFLKYAREPEKPFSLLKKCEVCVVFFQTLPVMRGFFPVMQKWEKQAT